LLAREDKKMSSEKIEKNKGARLLAGISYLWILCLLPIVLGVKNKFVRYHAKQGLGLFIAEIILWIISVIPVIGWLIGFLTFILAIIFSVTGLVKALSGEIWRVPFIGKISEKIKI